MGGAALAAGVINSCWRQFSCHLAAPREEQRRSTSMRNARSDGLVHSVGGDGEVVEQGGEGGASVLRFGSVRGGGVERGAGQRGLLM